MRTGMPARGPKSPCWTLRLSEGKSSIVFPLMQLHVCTSDAPGGSAGPDRFASIYVYSYFLYDLFEYSTSAASTFLQLLRPSLDFACTLYILATVIHMLPLSQV